MDENDTHEALRQFLMEAVQSYEQLEILLLLYQRSGQQWAAESIAARLNIPADAASLALESLAAHKLLVFEPKGPDVAWRYDPAQPLHARVVDLAQCHAAKRIVVIGFMSANALERVRTAGLKTFAEAFRLRRR